MNDEPREDHAIRRECLRRFTTLENKVYLGNGTPSHDARLTAAETQLRSILWIVRIVLGGVITNLIGLGFLLLRRGI